MKEEKPWSSAPCLWRGHSGQKCWAAVGHERTYCKQHKTKAWDRPWVEPLSRKFKQNRPIVISKAKGICQMQEPGYEKCVRRGTQVDHIKPRSEGGTDDLFNLQLLCDECHKRKTLADQMERLAGNKPKKR